jgi:hypothetical protein
VSYVEVQYEMSERHACRLVGLARSTNRYRARKAARDAARLKELAAKRMRFGYRRLTEMLIREGMAANHKRVASSGSRNLGARDQAFFCEVRNPLPRSLANETGRLIRMSANGAGIIDRCGRRSCIQAGCQPLSRSLIADGGIDRIGS